MECTSSIHAFKVEGLLGIRLEMFLGRYRSCARNNENFRNGAKKKHPCKMNDPNYARRVQEEKNKKINLKYAYIQVRRSLIMLKQTLMEKLHLMVLQFPLELQIIRLSL